MPKSKVRKKSDYVAPTTRYSSTSSSSAAPFRAPSPTWYPILLVAVLLIGLAWISTYYIAGERVPFMDSLGAWNFAVGFAFMVAGLVLAVRWR